MSDLEDLLALELRARIAELEAEQNKTTKTFCPNCEKDTECEFIAELYKCKECGEDFAKYIVGRKTSNEKSQNDETN